MIPARKDYYPFGMVMASRNLNADSYRFGYNTQEKTDEISGTGNSYTAEYWQYDSRLARRWNLDPKPIIGISDYIANGNNPIYFTDPLGDFKTKFGAWLYKKTHGGGELFKDAGGEWGINKSTFSNGEVTVRPSIFDWSGRSEGKDLNLEASIKEWKKKYEEERHIDWMVGAGIYDRNLTAKEARDNLLDINAAVVLPNVIKFGTNITNIQEVNQGFKIEGRLEQIFNSRKLFSNWLKANNSLSRVSNPLNATEAQQIIENSKKLGITIESNLKGLQGLEQTGQWAGIPHFKVGNVHIPIQSGVERNLKF